MGDSVIALIWLMVNGQLFFSCWQLSRRMFPGDSCWQLINHMTLSAYAMIVLIRTILGSVGLLYPWLYLCTVGLIGFIGILALHFNPSPNNCPPQQPAPGAQCDTRQWKNRTWLVVWGLLFWFWIGLIVFNGLMKFPSDYDTLVYHLALVDFWLQAHNLYAPHSLFWSVPCNNELFTLWLVGPFTGDFLYALTNLPATVLLACGALEVGRCVGLTLSIRNLASLAVVTNHVVFYQLQNAGNDIATAGTFLTSLGYILRFSANRRRSNLLLGAAALGLLTGIKFYALGYVCVSILFAIYLIARNHGFRTTVKTICPGLVSLILLGGYWYARNFLVTGSPLYPLGGKADCDDGTPFYPALWQSTLLGNKSPELFALWLKAIWVMTGPCHLTAFLCLPVTLTWLLCSEWLLRRCRRPYPLAGRRSALLLATLSSFAVMIVTPFAVEDCPGTLNQMHQRYCPVRYGLIFLSLSVMCSALTLNDLSFALGKSVKKLVGKTCGWLRPLQRLPQRALNVLLIGLIAYQAWHEQRTFAYERAEPMLLGVNGFLVTAIAFILFDAPIGFRRLLGHGGGLFLLTVFVLSVMHLSQRWHAGFPAHFDRQRGGVCQRLCQTRPSGTTICVFDGRIYPFFGSKREFRVIQAPPRKAPGWWEQSIRSKGIRVIAGTSEGSIKSGWETAEPWFAQRVDLFRQVNDRPGPYEIFITLPAAIDNKD